MIFDVKLDSGFTHKERLVVYGQKVDTPPSMTYDSVVSRDSVIFVLLFDSLNGLGVQYYDVHND